MNVKIEDYRGFEIIFNTETERFSFTLDEGHWAEKQTYAVCKKNIDDYLKANIEFKPFKVRSFTQNNISTIIGIRKDNRFIILDESGRKDQISEYDEKNYIIYDEKDNAVYDVIRDIHKQEQVLREKISEQFSKIDTPSLSDVKDKYINKV
jgi:hypothetical protein